MKTKYFSEAQLALLDINSALSNPAFLDVAYGIYFAGLLSSLPLENTDDGWQGAAELFSVPGSLIEGIPGIKNPSTNTGAYQPVRLAKNNFITPVVVNTSLGYKGVVNEYRAPIEFPIASSGWGVVKGLVVYGVRSVSTGVRITPLFTVPFIAPSTVNTNDKLTVENQPNTRMRAVELIKKNTA